ncbi:hypothetical protein KFL_001220200 [Klebsormidium nitens]|uniref:Uncharacterized protein n=1 Tax=Klebsormidium nitens TaxID=105231 RepID=A0A1Y1I0S8_KLENI|nr:hypothetical protein KFL_001220200 [Klebsormidium nitens]|eukprot:GAQ82751.1 hypothetical protein KFL_001220200 [Klebsormidium nitens]
MEMKKLFKKLLDEVLNPAFLPQWGSGGHAILVAMLKARQQGKLEMPIEHIKEAAEATHLCKHSFYSKGGQAWKAMSELEREKLVARKTGAILHKPGLYFTNVAGSQHQLRLSAKGVKAAERMLFLSGPNQGTAPVESPPPTQTGQSQVPVAPPAPIKKRPKKNNVVKPSGLPRQVNPSIGWNLRNWMNQAKKRPRVTAFDKSGTGPVFEKNVVRKLFLDEIQEDVKGQAKVEVKKEVKIEKEEGISSEWPKVAAPGTWAPVKLEQGNMRAGATVKKEGSVIEGNVDLGFLAARNMGQPSWGDVKNVRVKKEAI